MSSDREGGGAPVRILYGSEMGNCEFVADDLQAALRERGVDGEILELNDLAVAELPLQDLLLIIVSTYGEGEMPYGADGFWEDLDEDDAPRLEGVRFAVLALGDQSYTYFCEAGVLIDARLADLGATRIADRVDCDSNYHAEARRWIADRVDQLAPQAAGDGVAGDGAGAIVAGDGDAAVERAEAADAERPQPSRWTRANPFAARVVDRRLLSGPGSAKEVVHYELDLAGSGIELEPGDSIAVVPENGEEAVDAFLAAAGLSGTEMLHARSLRSFVLREWELRFPSMALLETIADRQPETELGARMRDGDRSGVDAWIQRNSVIDALSEARLSLRPVELESLMLPIRHRAYSVASSRLVYPGRVHLTVATQRQPEQAIPVGIGTGHLAERGGELGRVGVYPLPNRLFTLPENDGTPIIMIGPGVGVAPFRAFLQERRARSAGGPAWLFFGDQHRGTDFLYEEEWQEFLDSGTLTRLDLAFSRDQAERVYVQHRMREQAVELVRWISKGAVIYVCGDAGGMAHDVDLALREILADAYGTVFGGSAYDALVREKRYRRDVY